MIPGIDPLTTGNGFHPYLQAVISCPLEGNLSVSYQWYFAKLLAMGTDQCSHNKFSIYLGNHLNITLLNNNQTLYFCEFDKDYNAGMLYVQC